MLLRASIADWSSWGDVIDLFAEPGRQPDRDFALRIITDTKTFPSTFWGWLTQQRVVFRHNQHDNQCRNIQRLLRSR